MIEHLGELVLLVVACLLAVGGLLAFVVGPALLRAVVDGRDGR